MEIKLLKANQYRNYASLSLRPYSGVNVLVGENAQGKTNMIEALFLCALGRSHRSSKDSELIMNGCAGAYVGVDIKNGSGDHSIEMKLRIGEKKQVYIDKLPIKKSAELMGQLNVVMFSPEDLRLVKDGPAERRRFIDMELSQLYPAYYVLLQRYNLALKQRNALLKSDTAGLSTLSVWDEQLATYGAKIIEKREAFIKELESYAAPLHKDVSGGREELTLLYKSNPNTDEKGYALTGILMEMLQKCAADDLRRGFTTIGPHRDDLELRINGQDVRVYGSQGQQRTAALSVKLSEIELFQRMKNEKPVLLLDDVLSELDDRRGRLLLERLRECQCFLSCTSLEGLKKAGLSEYHAWICKNGTLFEKQ